VLRAGWYRPSGASFCVHAGVLGRRPEGGRRRPPRQLPSAVLYVFRSAMRPPCLLLLPAPCNNTLWIVCLRSESAPKMYEQPVIGWNQSEEKPHLVGAMPSLLAKTC
jgi:hypothetical protein